MCERNLILSVHFISELRTANLSSSVGRTSVRTRSPTSPICLYFDGQTDFTYSTTLSVPHLGLVFPIFDRLNIKHCLAGDMTFDAGTT